jgi:hypothetical protein
MQSSRDLLLETEAKRLDLLSAIGRRHDAAAIAYLTSTRAGIYASINWKDMLVLEPHVRAARDQGVQNLDIVLVTHGGISVAPWDIMAMIREYVSGTVRVILPAVAYSAGTLISLGADEVVMGPGSILGPVDGQFHWPSGKWLRHASVSDFQAFLDFVKDQGLTGGDIRKKIPEWFVTGMDAPAVGALYRMLREDKRVIGKMLGSRRLPLSRGANQKIADFLLIGVGEHGQSIRRTEARQAGLSFIADIEKSGVESEVGQLYAIYSDILKLGIPHAVPSAAYDKMGALGDEFDFDAYGHHASETPVAIVESLHDTNPAYIAYGLRHWNETPPVPPLAPADATPAEAVRPPAARAREPSGRGMWISERHAAARSFRAQEPAKRK